MSGRRMFSKQIIDSDAFLDMPLSTQALYFHLAMRADDDGFVNNPKKIMRMTGSNDDELKVLLTKRFILVFESGVIVIKHWRIHNCIQKDRYKPTVYQNEFSKLKLKENNGYTLETECKQIVSKMETQVSIGKERIEKVRIEKTLPTSDEVADYPDFLKVETKALFDEYFKNRPKKKFAITPRAKKSLFKQLTEKAKGNDAYAYRMIERALLNSWGEFWELKDEKGNVIEPQQTAEPEKKLTPEESQAMIKQAMENIKAKMNQGYSEPEQPVNKKEATEGLMNFCDNFGR
jgi:hypothetical protein